MKYTMEVKPTEYKGILFRSRLEARWAVYFDLIGLRWEYEPEQVLLSDGSTYNPDFRLDGNWYAEVKPDMSFMLGNKKLALMPNLIGLAGPPYRGFPYPVAPKFSRKDVFKKGPPLSVEKYDDPKYGAYLVVDGNYRPMLATAAQALLGFQAHASLKELIEVGKMKATGRFLIERLHKDDRKEFEKHMLKKLDESAQEAQNYRFFLE